MEPRESCSQIGPSWRPVPAVFPKVALVPSVLELGIEFLIISYYLTLHYTPTLLIFFFSFFFIGA